MVTYRIMTIEDYEGVYTVWMNTPGMGLNTTDDSREGIEKYLKRNPTTSFWEHIGFTERDDVVYRNKNIHFLDRIDT